MIIELQKAGGDYGIFPKKYILIPKLMKKNLFKQRTKKIILNPDLHQKRFYLSDMQNKFNFYISKNI